MVCKVLILEDEPLIAWDIEEELISRGWDVVATVATIASAFDALAAHNPEIAVLDVNLGKETSFDLARHCASNGTAVVFLTGQSAGSGPEDLRHVPICSKPVDYNALQAVLEAAATQLGT